MFGFFKKKSKGKDIPISAVTTHLKIMGYDLTDYGVGVAGAELLSGYSEVEVASHIALTTMALDIKNSRSDILKLMSLHAHGMALLHVLKEYKDKQMIHPTQWQHDTKAIFAIITIDEHQGGWIDKILSDPMSGKERLANSRVQYTTG